MKATEKARDIIYSRPEEEPNFPLAPLAFESASGVESAESPGGESGSESGVEPESEGESVLSSDAVETDDDDDFLSAGGELAVAATNIITTLYIIFSMPYRICIILLITIKPITKITI